MINKINETEEEKHKSTACETYYFDLLFAERGILLTNIYVNVTRMYYPVTGSVSQCETVVVFLTTAVIRNKSELKPFYSLS